MDKYEKMEFEIIRFGMQDIVMASPGSGVNPTPTPKPEEDEGEIIIFGP